VKVFWPCGDGLRGQKQARSRRARGVVADSLPSFTLVLGAPSREGRAAQLRSPARRLATTHHSFLSSFSAGSKRNFATKYAFFQVFRDLQNYLADFFEKSCKTTSVYKRSQTFAKFLRNFRIFSKKVLIFAKISDFLQIF
jgi:hypothetical protein